MAKQDKQKFYRKGLHFECTACGNCCTKSDGYVQLTAIEAAAIADVLAIPLSSFLENYTHIDQPDGAINLKSRDNGDCVFLEDDRCGVYTARPKQCRTFPFWPENLKSAYRWRMVSAECPGIGEGRLWTMEDIEKIRKS